MPKRELPEVNAGSMADIAFTLLIFFLVSTTLATDKGEKVMLPKWSDTPLEEQDPVKVSDWNVLAVDVLSDGSLALEGANFPYSNLEKETVRFLTNNGKDPNYSESYDKAVVNIRTHPDAPYDKYLEAYSNVKAAFTLIRDDYSMNKYGKKYEDFTEADSQASADVRDKYPLKIAENMIEEDDLKQ